jgi:hypothetical protein
MFGKISFTTFFLSPILLPIHPAPRILSHVHPATLSCQFRCSPAPHPSFAVKDQLGILIRLLKAVPVFKFFSREE